jgi:hypothetical protein
LDRVRFRGAHVIIFILNYYCCYYLRDQKLMH